MFNDVDLYDEWGNYVGRFTYVPDNWIYYLVGIILGTLFFLIYLIIKFCVNGFRAAIAGDWKKAVLNWIIPFIMLSPFMAFVILRNINVSAIGFQPLQDAQTPLNLVPGSGNVIAEVREVGDFRAIEVDYPGQIIVTQGSSVSVEVESDDNFLPGLQTRVRNGTLEIFYDVGVEERVNPSKDVKITIVVKELDRVQLDSAGEISIKNVESNKLQVSVGGAGNLDLRNVEVKELSVDLSGAGNVVVSGMADDLNLSMSGFGSFNGKDLHTKTARVEMSGAGSATVWVDDELDADISGAGSVNYYGSPDVLKDVSGVGSVSRSGDK